MDEQRKWLLEMESPLGEDAVETFKMTTKDLKYHINLVNKTTVGLERTVLRSSGMEPLISTSYAHRF